MPFRFINPNFHVILIHYPLGVFVLGVVLEVLSFLWPRSSVRTAVRWMILLGGLAMLPALMSGVYALSDVVENQGVAGQRYHMLSMHVWLQSIATLLGVTIIVIALAVPRLMHGRSYWVLLLGLVITLGIMTVGSWFGGETVYRQDTAITAITPTPGAAPDNANEGRFQHALDFYVQDPLQIHLIVVSLVLAFAAAALGLTIRNLLRIGELETAGVSPDETAALRAPFESTAVVVSAAPPGAMTAARRVEFEPIAAVPAARFWVFAAVCAVLAVLAGWWSWAAGNGAWKPGKFLQDVMLDNHHLAWTRQSAHVICGVLILLAIIALAIQARWASRNRPFLICSAVLLVLLVAAQFWLGILLAFSGPEGSVYHFADASQSITMHQAPGTAVISDARR